MTPQISAIIAVYNGRSFLRKAVESVISQTLLPTELILVDDGSTDDSLSVIADVRAPFPIVPLTQGNKGQSAARNYGAREAKGEFLAFLDQDDWWYPHHLERLYRPFSGAKGLMLGWVYSNVDEYDENGYLVNRRLLDLIPSPHPKVRLSDMLSQDMFILPSASLIRKEAFWSVGGFCEELSGYEDDDLFLRLFRRGWENVYLNTPLSGWRIRDGSASYTPRMSKSRRLYAGKLLREFRDEPWRNRYWVRDCIAPRFFSNAIARYTVALRRRDYDACREAIEDAMRYWGLMDRSYRTSMHLLLMRHPMFYLWTQRAVRTLARLWPFGTF